MKCHLPRFNSTAAKLMLLAVAAVLWCASANAEGLVPAEKLALKIQRAATNSADLVLTLTGAQPKKYYLLSAPSASGLTWNVEAEVDCAVSPVVIISAVGRPSAFFKAISADDFDSAKASGVLVLANEPAKRITAVKGGKEWFVDGKIGHDGLDGRLRQRNANSGPLATIKKALALSQAGDSVTIAGGTYSENLNLSGKNVAVKLEGNVVLH